MREYDFDDDEPYVVIEKHSGSTSSFLIGLAVGAGVALLLAPQTGRVARRTIRRRATRAKETAQQVASGVTESVVDTFNDARRRVEEQIDSARDAIEFKKQQVARAMDAGRTAAQEARDELELRIAETKAAYRAGEEVARTGRRRAAMPAGDNDSEEV